uniref:Tudor domain-containing protein n=1 Tax=Panagrolaimus davidi TaxID=227884 RepID=A0A914QKU5_9BILA
MKLCIKTLPEKVSPYPGFDATSLYSIIKPLGPSFIRGTEKYNAKDGITYIYIKNSNRGMNKDEYRMILRSILSFLMPKLPIPIFVNGIKNVKTIDLVNLYPRALCICYYNNVPYRAQIVAQITSTKINVELVDVGEFLTATIDQLKVSASDELSEVPRFSIPCKIVNDTKQNLRISLDGFDRRSTSNSVPLYLTQKTYKNYVSTELF